MSQLEHIEAIEKRLWSAADNLRANSRQLEHHNLDAIISVSYWIPTYFGKTNQPGL